MVAKCFVSRGNRGFTLVEMLVATAAGIVVLGGAIAILVLGQNSLRTVTEHASFREEALRILEMIDRDMKGLVVSEELNPLTKVPYMVQPYDLLDPQTQEGKDPETGRTVEFQVPSGIRFHRYHHTQTVAGPDGPTPQLIGQQIIYQVRPIPGRRGAVDLLRNGVRINTQPLSGVLFQPADPILAAKSVGAAPNAILQVTVVPKGGMWGSMTPATIQALRDTGTVVTTQVHLVGYESQFTLFLWMAMVKRRANQRLSEIENEVLQSAERMPNVRIRVEQAIQAINDVGYQLDENRVVLLQQPFIDRTAGTDPAFQNAPEMVSLDAETLVGTQRRTPVRGRYGVSSGFTLSDLGAM